MTLDDAMTEQATAGKTVAEEAYRLMRGDLIAGRLPPATRLRMNVLHTRYGLGLSPLREALLRLASEGFVVAEGQRGFAVAPVSLSELNDLSRTRRRLETLALSDAITKGDTDWEAEIITAHHRLSRQPMPTDTSTAEDILAWDLRHRAFHDALISACDSPWLIRLRSQLVDHSERYVRARLFSQGSTATTSRLDRAKPDEHEMIMKAVLARDAAKATALLDRHIERTAAAAAQWFSEHRASTSNTRRPGIGGRQTRPLSPANTNAPTSQRVRGAMTPIT